MSNNPYVGAYPFLDARRGVWREVSRYVRRDAPFAEHVVELGAGYCDFINTFPASRKVAYDLNPEMQRFADDDVELRIGDATRLLGLEAQSVDLVFASNFLEHLDDAELTRLLENCRRVLKPGGRMVVLQPNYRRCADHYFDDPTHKTIFCDQTLGEFFARHGFEVLKMEPGLLPFSMKNNAPKWPLLVRAYLASPLRPLAAQMYAVATPLPGPNGEGRHLEG